MIPWLPALMVTALLMSGCGTKDSTLQAQGRSPSYLTGFHDGRVVTAVSARPLATPLPAPIPGSKSVKRDKNDHDKVAGDAVKGVDTDALKSLEK